MQWKRRRGKIRDPDDEKEGGKKKNGLFMQIIPS